MRGQRQQSWGLLASQVQRAVGGPWRPSMLSEALWRAWLWSKNARNPMAGVKDSWMMARNTRNPSFRYRWAENSCIIHLPFSNHHPRLAPNDQPTGDERFCFLADSRPILFFTLPLLITTRGYTYAKCEVTRRP